MKPLINFNDNVFQIDTEHTSYLLRIMPTGHLEHLYYGKRIKPAADYSPLYEKFGSGYGNSIAYSQDDPALTLDNICLEYSNIGTGDYRHSPIEIKLGDGSFSTDFIYLSHRIYDGIHELVDLPCAAGDLTNVQTLEIELVDAASGLSLTLFYTTFPDCDTLTRKVRLTNAGPKSVFIKKLMSLQIDLPHSGYTMLTFDGAWIRERHKHEKQLVTGLYVNDSTTGSSSNRHNPLMILKKNDATEFNGECLAVNLVYSGNHYGAVEVSPFQKTRLMIGINPYLFEWRLDPHAAFTTPEAVLTFSAHGLNGVSQNLHRFIADHIVRGPWSKRERPILINNWEATYFDFNQNKILGLAKEAAKLGIELFVLDDGWFGNRNSDRCALGDWFVNTQKLPGGLKALADSINAMGMSFGLWFEPEMISEDSDLYRAHPDWAVKIPGRRTSLGRNQMVLDLTRPEVRDYLVESVSAILNSANIEYVKWDMNRHLSDYYSATLDERQGEFGHRYILGLYDVIKRICAQHPHVLFESCSSGGNRFDLGMLCYMPQIWTSDNTDAWERIAIQRGTSYGYPLSTMGAHVSASPNHQTLRTTPLESRFNTAAFGVLGYELDLNSLSPAEKRAIKAQVAFYKKHRRLLQFGRFYRLDPPVPGESSAWIVVSEDKSEALLGFYQRLATPNPPAEILITYGLDDDRLYRVEARKQSISIKSFGSLINCVTPVKIKGDGIIHNTISRYYMLESETESYTAYGDLLNNAGIKIKQQFTGIGYNQDVRLMGDFGSRLYYFKAIDEVNDDI